MALSDVTRKEVRSDLRSRLGKLTTDDFSDAEINRWLNLAQFDVFVRLSSISDVWYGSTQTVSISANKGIVTPISLANAYSADKIAKISKLVNASGYIVPFVTDNEIHSIAANSNYDNSYAVNWYGEKLYYFNGASNNDLSTSSHTLYFIRKPDEMTGDSNVHTVTFTNTAGDGKYLNLWIGNQAVRVYGRTTPPVSADYDGIVFKISATPDTQRDNMVNAINAAFGSTGVVAASGGTGIVTITGASNVTNVDMTNTTCAASTSACVDVPTEYVDLVVMSALSKALFKLNMVGEKNQVDNDISSRFNDIRQLYSSEIQINQAEKIPGTQTPRMR